MDRPGNIRFNLTHRFEHRTLKDDDAVAKYEIPFGGDMSFKSINYRIDDNIQQVST